MVSGVSLIGLLAVAASLEPDPRGWGTHQQLGLPPCTIRFLYGMRCPSCGMTTSWAYMMRGKFVDAAYANVGGSMLAFATMFVGPWLLLSGYRGRLLGHLSLRGAVFVAAALMIVTVLDWAWRLV